MFCLQNIQEEKMTRYTKFRETDPTAPEWIKRINEKLVETKETQNDLADVCRVAKSTVSAWLNPNSTREPTIIDFIAIADHFGVSADYLLGADECEMPDNEEIHKVTGLSDKAINSLKIASGKETPSGIGEKTLAVCNFLLENYNNPNINISSVGLFDSLYDYLFGKFDIRQANGAPAYIVSKSPDGKEKKMKFSDAFLSRASFSRVQSALLTIKDKLQKDQVQKANEPFESWGVEYKGHSESEGIDE
jgi:transcriptional regulator with XRE-family HTH domain